MTLRTTNKEATTEMNAKATTRPSCVWQGRSGTRYTYKIWKLPVSLRTGQDGNYIYAKRNREGQWVPVYIGEGDLGERSGPGHHKADCIRRKGATHFHCHLNSDAAARRVEEADLLSRFTNAYAPSGCNERPGG